LKTDPFACALTNGRKYPESYDPAIPERLVFSGKCGLTDKIKVETGEEIPAGKLVLSPTRTYAPVIKAVLDEYRPQIDGMVHCSGGGQTKVLHFIDGLHVIKDDLFRVPPVFELIQRQSGTDWREMYKVFNMGHRMEIYVPEAIAGGIIAIAEAFGIAAKVIGRVEPSPAKKVTVRSPEGEFVYG